MGRKFSLIEWRKYKRYVLVLAVIGIVFSVSLAGLIFHVRSNPVNIDFAKPYIEAALRNEENGIHASMEEVVLHWPDLSGPIYLGIHGAKVLNAADDVILSIDEAGLGLARGPLLIGRVAPVALVLRNLNLKLIRTENGKIDIGFGAGLSMAGAANKKIEDQTKLTASILNHIARPGEASKSSPLGTLKAFEIQDAKVSVEDRAMGESWQVPDADIVLQSAAEGLQGELQLNFESDEDVESYIASDFLVYWDTKEVKTEATFRNFDLNTVMEKFPSLGMMSKQDVLLDARVTALLDPNLKPLEATVKLISGEGEINVPSLYDDPLAYSEMYLDLAYEDKADDQTLEILGMGITARNVKIEANTNLDFGRERIAGPVRVEIKELQHAQIEPLWPKPLHGDSSEEWILEKLSEGTFKNAFAQADIELLREEEGWSFDFTDLIAGFDFENLNANYRAPLTPVTNGSGSGTFDLTTERLKLNIDSGEIGELIIQSGELQFDRIIEKGAGIAHIETKLDGPLRSVFEYVKNEPIGQTQDFDISKVKGQAALDVVVDFPLSKDVKKEEVKVGVEGKLNETFIPAVVKDIDFTDGTLDLKVEDITFSISGKGKILDRDINLEYQGFVNSDGQKYARKLNADFISNGKTRDRFGFDVADFLEGEIPISLVYTEFNDKPSRADMQLDLTPARFFVDAFDYEKPVGTKGNASLTAIVEDGRVTEVSDLVASAPNFSLEKTALIFRKEGQGSALHLGKVSRFTLDETIARVDFEVEKSGRYKIVMNGPFLDLRPFLDSKDKEENEGDNPAFLLSISVDAMRAADDVTMQYGKLYVDIDSEGRFNQLEVDAIAGAGDIYLRYKPDEQGVRTFRFEADDAGATLKAFGVYDRMVGGTMVIYGEPIRSVYDRNLVGIAEIKDFKIVKAPTLAKMLSALSLQGMQSFLSNEGVSFSKLKANFDWLYRPEGSLMVLKDGRTSGNELGLTFDGVVDNAGGDIDVSGTIVPLSTVNKVISNIPLVGDILTGGSGGIFAATYAIKGKTKDPKITVNPLAALAPGILRRILFEQN